MAKKPTHREAVDELIRAALQWHNPPAGKPAYQVNHELTMACAGYHLAFETGCTSTTFSPRGGHRGIRYGTSHFVSREAAIRYYREYGYENVAEAVDRKLAEGEIHIGKPDVLPGARLSVIPGEGRYQIEFQED